MRSDDIAAVECVDTGQTIRFMSAAAIRGAENFRFFADHAPDANNGRSMPDEHHINFSSRHALGPVGVITPWNTPFMLSTWKIAPALAAGCTVVHKPAEWSPYTAAMLSEIAVEAGLPPGVLNTVHGFGESAGKALTEHPLIMPHIEGMKSEIIKYHTLVKSIKPLDQRKDAKGKDTFVLSDWWRCNSGELPHFAFVLCAVLTNAPNSCPPERLFSMFNATFGKDQQRSFGY